MGRLAAPEAFCLEQYILVFIFLRGHDDIWKISGFYAEKNCKISSMNDKDVLFSLQMTVRYRPIVVFLTVHIHHLYSVKSVKIDGRR
jgi:hypothetical protein